MKLCELKEGDRFTLDVPEHLKSSGVFIENDGIYSKIQFDWKEYVDGEFDTIIGFVSVKKD